MKKFIVVFLLLLSFSTSAFAAIVKYQDVVQDTLGNAIRGATITVYATGTTTTVTLYSNASGTATTANPTTSGSGGSFSFFITEGVYDLSIAKTGLTTQSKTYVNIGSPGSVTHSALTGTNVHGLGTMSTQTASDYSTTAQANSLYVPAAHSSSTGTNVHGLGTMSTQNSNNVNITGGLITGISITTATYPSVQSVVTDSRVVGTTYQNTTGRPMFVCVTQSSTAISTVSAFTDANAAPTTEVVRDAVAGVNYPAFVSFVVLPGNYYKTTSNDGTPSVIRWTEWY